MQTNHEFAEYIAHKRLVEPRFDQSDLDLRFAPYFRTGQRIKVEIYGQTITGTVGVTTGWRPAFILMRRANAHGSSDVLGPSARIVAVKIGRKYVATLSLPQPTTKHGV